ncbi:T9SS type A sorting domain-containing protein [Flavobacterium luminosum]|uniref:T9SS type A sorting domain-containing protein n=1 Tax=Flavobacterium luminosum TaxID=2949086 RepID=A0ABT0TL45_9FLAO|nr:T9SS type A sorting domain-containing protein [Flavobacterium sp. HXWNR70]MCL9808120.1 T9SS type A sorting domain-containing protein [Flavobacterium sp. HXWNR70]
MASFLSNAQDQQSKFIRCSSIEYEESLKAKFQQRNSISEFEKWIAPIVEKVKEGKKNKKNNRSISRIIRIPVVVHVMHNGDALGSGENISDAQVKSQIEVLNQDFRKMINTNGYNTNPVGADLEIEFVLAKRKPDGTSTTGIDRVSTKTVSYNSMANVETMKSTTIWDPTKYLNMWTINIGGKSPWNQTLGYAQFPQGSNLIGVYGGDDATTPSPALTDGLVMRYEAFGSRDIHPGGTYLAGYDLGRTVTHEIGHWLGLRHIWGDGDCSVDDYCTDTPNAGQANYTCDPVDSCPDGQGNDMIENYMDYTNDACMNIFTNDQKNRVIAVMHNSLRRKELLSSPALVPLNLPTEGSLSIEDIGLNPCSKFLNTVLKLTNYGTNNITSAQILFDFDGVGTQTYNWTGNLAPNASTNINLPSMYLANTSQSFYASLEKVNNITDGYITNNEVGKIVDSPNVIVGNNVVFNLKPDHYADEIEWNLKDINGNILQSSPKYDIGDSTLKTYNWNLPNGCYTLTVIDTYGDGLNYDANGLDGYYNLYDQNNNKIFEGGGHKNQVEHKFAINTLSNNDFEFDNFSLYPNPNKGNFTVKFDPETNDKINIDVYDLRGRQIFERSYVNNGTFNQEVNLNNISSGVYLITISNGQKKTTKRIVIE